MKIITRVLIFILFCPALYSQTQQDPVDNGMVVSASALASQIGVNIMKVGGNAIDAAVATGFALAVTYPQAGNIGGGGFLIAHLANGENISLDFREAAPEMAHRDMFLAENGAVVKDMSLKTHSASGVPGSVAGLITAWKEYGSGQITLPQILEPSISLAEEGFKISEELANSLNDSRALFEDDLGAAEIFIPNGGEYWKRGDTLVQKDLAQTLQRIVQSGTDDFYRGKTAQLIAKEMKSGNGLITLNDLNNYVPKRRAVVIGTYKDYDVVSMGLPSSGGILLIQMLNMLERFNLDSMEFNSADYIHLLTEIERLAYADRAEHLGDSDYWDVPIDMLLSKKYAKNRAKSISPLQATPSSEVFAGQISAYESTETTHYSVIDRDGNAVSVSTTLNTSFGSGKVVDGAGFLLNNEMDDFSVKPGIPNIFGLVGKEANAVQPNKRPLSSMSPTIVLKNDEPFIIIGSPGGSMIITTVLQVLLNIIDHNMTIMEAVSAPRTHSQWLPDVIMFERDSMSDSVKIELGKRGHTLIPYQNDKIGSVNAILINNKGYFSGADPRRENVAVGY